MRDFSPGAAAPPAVSQSPSGMFMNFCRGFFFAFFFLLFFVSSNLFPECYQNPSQHPFLSLPRIPLLACKDRGEGGDQSAWTNPHKKRIHEKRPEGENLLGRGHKSPHGELCSSHALNLGLKLWPLMTMCACGCGAGIWMGVFESTFFFW